MIKKNRTGLLIPLLALLVWGGIKLYKIPDQKAGTTAVDFTGYTSTGDSLKLSDFRGQWVLLHFWGSWCGPCRQHNHHLPILYQKYQDQTFQTGKGFSIISVGLETKQERWQRAIKTDGLVWSHHISDLKRMKDHVAQAYGVREIPATFLINPLGEVIRVNATTEELDVLLSDQQVSR